MQKKTILSASCDYTYPKRLKLHSISKTRELLTKHYWKAIEVTLMKPVQNENVGNCRTSTKTPLETKEMEKVMLLVMLLH